VGLGSALRRRSGVAHGVFNLLVLLSIRLVPVGQVIGLVAVLDLLESVWPTPCSASRVRAGRGWSMVAGCLDEPPSLRTSRCVLVEQGAVQALEIDPQAAMVFAGRLRLEAPAAATLAMSQQISLRTCCRGRPAWPPTAFLAGIECSRFLVCLWGRALKAPPRFKKGLEQATAVLAYGPELQRDAGLAFDALAFLKRCLLPWCLLVGGDNGFNLSFSAVLTAASPPASW